MRETGSPLNSSTKNDGIGIFEITQLTVEDGMEAGKKQGGDIGEEAITKV